MFPHRDSAKLFKNFTVILQCFLDCLVLRSAVGIIETCLEKRERQKEIEDSHPFMQGTQPFCTACTIIIRIMHRERVHYMCL